MVRVLKFNRKLNKNLLKKLKVASLPDLNTQATRDLLI